MGQKGAGSCAAPNQAIVPGQPLMANGMLNLLWQAAMIASAYGLFFAFIFLVWWIAWRLSLSKVPILRECFGCAPAASKQPTEPSASSSHASEAMPVRRPAHLPRARAG